ncbi:MAG TPA: site-2 protease family protein [Anaeromyxobacteraceae bacterium]|nr:site-2 protease family protein [Anaeromyxobacteraceae bacterium]
MVSFGAIVVLLGGLIFVHELGHFAVAKLLGVKVIRFSIGFGPRILGFRRGETEYRISLLPLGGYVKMAGDDPSEEMAPEDRGRGFLEQPPWKRLVIALAGPAFNLAFPFVLFFAVHLAQNGSPVPDAVVGMVTPGPAAAAGLRPGDRILSVAAPGQAPRRVRSFDDLPRLVSPHPGLPLVFEVERDGRRVEPVTIVPAAERDPNPVEKRPRGVIGVAADFAPAVVAPVVPGAAGPLEPFDLVVRAGGAPVRHLLELERAVAAASCGPLDLEVVRERPVVLPGARPATAGVVKLAGVPTCADGAPAIVPAVYLLSTYVATVVPGSPADRAGIRRGDAIVSVNGKPVRTFKDVDALGAFRLEGGRGAPVALGLRDGRSVELAPVAESYVDEDTNERLVRPFVGLRPDDRPVVSLGALRVNEVTVRRGIGEVAAMSWDKVVGTIRWTVLGIAMIATGEVSFRTVGGPLYLFTVASSAAEEGLDVFLSVMALISVNLGLLNLFPIPVLDGGHIAAAVVESVTRRPLSIRTREIANLIGLILIVTLMVFVFRNDILRLLPPPPGAG